MRWRLAKRAASKTYFIVDTLRSIKSNKNYTLSYHPKRATLNNVGIFFQDMYVWCIFSNLGSRMYFFNYYKHFLVSDIPWVSIARRPGKVWKQDQGTGRGPTHPPSPAPWGMGLGKGCGDCSLERGWLQLRRQSEDSVKRLEM